MKWIGQHIYDLTARFRSNVTIEGDLTVNGTYTQIDTDVTTTEQWLVTNDGTGPAAIINQKGSQDIFDVQDDGTSVFYIEDGGNVGIGTTSPSKTLDVVGNIQASSTVLSAIGDFGYITIGDGSKTLPSITFGGENDDPGNTGIFRDSENKLGFSGGGVDYLLAGNDFYRNTTGGAYIKGNASAASAPTYTFKGYQGTGMYRPSGVNDIGFSTNGSEKVRILSSGNVGIGTTSPASLLHVAGTVQVGVDDTGHDVTFFGDASGEKMIWDTSAANLTIYHTDEEAGLLVFTNGSAQTTKPQLQVGRSASEYWGAYCTDRTAHLVHRQDETSGSPNTSFEIWDSNTTDSAAYWVWRHANGSGGSLVEKMRLTKAGVLSVAELDISGNIDVDGITNLDAVDIDGAVQIDNTLTVGVDDTGHDVKFFGATSGRYMMWDESQNRLRLTDDAYLTLGDGDDIILFHNGSNSYLLNDTGDLYITNRANDKDIILQSDDGSGGTTAYLTLDGSAGYTTVQKNMVFADSVSSRFGTGGDLAIFHDGGQGYISLEGTGHLYIRNTTDNSDIIFQSDDGAGGNATYFKLDGSLATHDGSSTLTMYTKWDDNSIISLGTGNDIRLYHNGTNSYLDNLSGDYYIRQKANDKDLILECDDGSGGNTAYLTLDGSLGYTIASKQIRFSDGVNLYFGNSNDVAVKHDGTDFSITNNTGDFYIKNTTDDKDIIFQSDDGAGGNATYFSLDGSAATHDGSATTGLYTNWPDKSRISMGNGNDLQIYHDGSNSYISDTGTGNLSILTNSFRLLNAAADENMIQATEDGAVTLYHNNAAKVTTVAGGVEITGELQADSLDIDGVADISGAVTLGTPLATDQQKHVMHYDFQGYASGDGTNYEMANNLSDTNAPFEHNISIGADGTTATTVQNIIRSGGKVMPRACTLTRWTGWAAAAGSATAYVALFKVTPTRNSNTDLSAVLLDEFSYTALGNAKMEDFDETSFTATAIAAGDILITAMKSESGAVHYFTSTVEVEF